MTCLDYQCSTGENPGAVSKTWTPGCAADDRPSGPGFNLGPTKSGEGLPDPADAADPALLSHARAPATGS